jgi:hypothetical protein
MRHVKRTLPGPASLNKATKPGKKAPTTTGGVVAGVSPAAIAPGIASPAAAIPVSTDASTELERAQEHFAKVLAAGEKREAFEFKAYKSADVKTLLFQDFFDKCAYCESRYVTTAPVDVEHYRPKGRVKEEGDAHSGYWWLAMSWDNLLPACIFCNRHNGQVTPTPPKPSTKAGGHPAEIKLDEITGNFNSSLLLTTGKGDSFPISKTRLPSESLDYDSEDALLLDPCRDNPEKHLHFHIDSTAPLGLVLPKAVVGAITSLAHLIPVKNSATAEDIVAHATATGVSARGAVSIQTFGLNRIQLVRERTRILRRLEFFEQMLVEITKLVVDLASAPVHNKECTDLNERAMKGLAKMQTLITSQLREMTQPSAPYSAMVKAWVNDLRSRLQPVADAGGL